MAFSRKLAAALAGLGLGALAAAACTSEGSPLAKRTEEGGSAGSAGEGGSAGASAAGQAGAAGKGGAGGAGGAAGASGKGGAGGGAGEQGGEGGGPLVVEEPDGPPEFRFLNGVADVASIRLCLVPWEGNGPGPLDAAPQPALAFGAAQAPTLPAGFDAASMALRPHVLSGDLATAEGKTCQALVASPPANVRAQALPVLPAGTLTAPRSRLVVVTGCVGASAVPDVGSACGVGTDPQKGNLGLLLVELSRRSVPPGQVGLQVVHASAAMPSLQVQTLPFGGGLPVTVASTMEFGQIAPRPPLTAGVEPLFGISTVTGSQIKLRDADNGTDLITIPVATSLADSGLNVADVTPGKAFAVVVLGPKPGSAVDAAPVTPTRITWLKVSPL